ncbi:endonuclease MutS2 [Cohnella xylanilytica]|uniref:DNA mismatch repair protein MutS n=1 Tax=Cohnella xylanilytica TaxID=557555 RepID=A0A841TYE6_9BACL|nr:MutS2/Smr-associated SH3 domain-containing protein [Cohnella xylanilytica]MBB6692589.1 DNA mismatch repair protein MutS [Cohnella xylanilytica]GIO14824.1 endonuclease MutS2 [Cohnella xylanilytica]
MREPSLAKLEYRRAIDTLLSYATTYPGKKLAERLRPMTDRSVIEARLRETEEARRLIARGSQPPLPSLEGMEETMQLLGTGYILSEQQLGHVARFVRSCEQLRKFMDGKAYEAASVAGYSASMYDLTDLLREIENSVDRGMILDGASPELGKIRKRIRAAEEKLHKRLEGLMAKHADCLQERLVSQRNGRYVLPVKKELRKRIPGAVLDESASGQTVFVEPAEAVGLQMELSALRAEENREELQILARLTEEAENRSQELSVNIETVGHYDLLFAKAKWALAIDGRPVELNEEGVIELRGARHPFLAGKAVPLNVTVGDGYRTLLITGPNTGGKTATIKTVGLLTLMAQSGLLVPAEEGSKLSVFRAVEADIGDDQSLDRSLSTFSSHLKNVIDILAEADRRTLVLLDELATGTDPGEGIGLSIAVLEELHRRGAVVLATTHFNEIKEYARVTPGYRNARMAFDEETLRPLYRLDMGEAGNSYAFVIARKLGIAEGIVERARAIAEGLRSGRPSAPIAAAPAEGGETKAGDGGPRKVAKPERAAPAPAPAPAANSAAAPGSFSEDAASETEPELSVGDAVWIPSLGTRGVVYRLPDERGNLTVQIRGEKIKINRKRVTLAIEAKRLYPADYDLDIVFESVENRKKRKLMGKRHVEGLKIEKPPED